MAPEIHISDETWNRLKRWAIPLEDTVEDAIARVLDAAESHSGHLELDPFFASPQHLDSQVSTESPSNTSMSDGGVPKSRSIRAASGRKVPQAAYELPILRSIDKLGGQALAADVLNEVEKEMAHLLGKRDYELTKTGTEKRWQNTARWARAALVQKRLIKSDSERGVWELTAQGRKEARNRNP